MIDNAKACGLTFDEKAVADCVGPKPFDPLGQAHDEWKLIPWGPPKHRTVPANAALSNTVKLRLDGIPEYRPEGLASQSLDGYQQIAVIPPGELQYRG
jgi:hypothetical protein